VNLPSRVFSQQELSLANNLRSEQERFVRGIRSIRLDTSIVHPIARYVDSEMNELQNAVWKDPTLSEAEKEKALRSAIYFMTEVSRNLQQQKFDLYSIPFAVDAYKAVLSSLIQGRIPGEHIQKLDQRITPLLAAAFTQYEEFKYLDDLATYRSVASSPDFIFRFLESKPNFRFRDSLFVAAAMHNPMKFINYLNKRKGVASKILISPSRFIQEIVSLSEEKNVSELLPFLQQIHNNEMKITEILNTRKKTTEYFQMLVNTLQAPVKKGDLSSRYQAPLRAGIRQKALAFYVNQVNGLHDSQDAIRFASVKGLRALDLYYMITSCGEDLYTSSYLGLYKRLKQQMPAHSADSVFELVGFDNFHTFMRLAANYGVLSDFLSDLPAEHSRQLLHRYFSSIGNNTEGGLEMAMDIADSFGALADSPELLAIAENELKLNLDRVRSTRSYLGMRLYGILTQVFQLVKQDGNLEKLWVKLGNYDLLKRKDLLNRNGEIVELVLFYGDEDGVASFKNFQKLYSDAGKWTITRTPNWINVRSVSDQPVSIYANLPLEIEEGLDLLAQDSLMIHLGARGLEPSILVHRGHSYHLEKTLNRLQPSVKLAILGSCGGYNKSISIATINPDVHVIGSKKTGSKSINDPLIDEINETLVRKDDLLWPAIWDRLEHRFSRDQASLSLFSEYFPPSTNVGLFVLKLFRQEG
jgi:hypothetical protein